nr:uncharacterized protein LOC126531132 isoform X1 [Dermacentor andersoni]
MLAYVKYHDKYRAILPTRLIKVFSPKSEEDFDKAKTVQAFWRSEDGDIQGYYPAFVVALAGGLDSLRLKIKSMREPFPRLIEADEEETSSRKKELQEQPTSRTTKRKRLEAASILHERIIAQSDNGAESQENEEPQVEDGIIVQLRKALEKKDQENKRLKKELREAASLNQRLTSALLDKIEVARATAERLDGEVIAEYLMPCSLDAGTGLPKEMVPERANDAGIDAFDVPNIDAFDMPCSEQDLAASSGIDAPVEGGPIAGHCSASSEKQQPALAAPPAFTSSSQAQETPPHFTSASQAPTGLFEEVNGQVKVGEKTFMPLDKWLFVMKNVSDAKCGLELAKHFWLPSEAATRSLTGQACRSMATNSIKLPATPEKVEMVKNCLAKYIDLHPAPQPPREHRVNAVRKYLRTFFTEAARQGKRVRKAPKHVDMQ